MSRERIKLDRCITDGIVAHISIPKCGFASTSSALTSYESDHPFTHSDLDSAALSLAWPPQFTAIIREPVSKWVAGIAQYMHAPSKHDKPWDKLFDMSNPTFRDELFGTMVFDQHTEFQSAQVTHKVRGYTMLFRFDQFNSYYGWMHSMGYKLEWHHLNPFYANEKKLAIRYHLTRWLDDHPWYRDFVAGYFEEDYELYHQALNLRST